MKRLTKNKVKTPKRVLMNKTKMSGRVMMRESRNTKMPERVRMRKIQ